METLKIFSLANAFAHWGEIWNGTVYIENKYFLCFQIRIFCFLFMSLMQTGKQKHGKENETLARRFCCSELI